MYGVCECLVASRNVSLSSTLLDPKGLLDCDTRLSPLGIRSLIDQCSRHNREKVDSSVLECIRCRCILCVRVVSVLFAVTFCLALPFDFLRVVTIAVKERLCMRLYTCVSWCVRFDVIECGR